jgi:hypothetical protein
VELSVGIRPSLEALQARGIRLGIVCDVGFSGGAVLRELLEREGLLAYFSGWAPATGPCMTIPRSRRISSSTATASWPS